MIGEFGSSVAVIIVIPALILMTRMGSCSVGMKGSLRAYGVLLIAGEKLLSSVIIAVDVISFFSGILRE